MRRAQRGERHARRPDLVLDGFAQGNDQHAAILPLQVGEPIGEVVDDPTRERGRFRIGFKRQYGKPDRRWGPGRPTRHRQRH